MMERGMKTLAAAGLAGFAFAGAAQAASINSTISAASGGVVIEFGIIDDSRETLVNADGTVLERVPGTPPTYQYVGGAPATDTTLDVGDKLRGVFKATLYDVNAGTPEPFDTSFEVTAIFETEVLSKSGGPGAYSFTFGPSASFATELAGYANVSASAADLAGTMVAIFEDQTPNFSVTTGTLAGDEATATDGSPWAFLGFAGAGNEFWGTTVIPTDDVAALPSNLLGAGANIFLNRLAIGDSLSSGITILPTQVSPLGGFTEFQATATFQGSAGSSIWPVRDQTTVFFSAVPTPAAFGPGLAMLGGLMAARRRRAMQAA